MKYLMIRLPLVWLFCSGNPTIAGSGGSSETQNGIITAHVSTAEGNAVANAIVRLRPSGYLSEPREGLGKKSGTTIDLTTNADGNFTIETAEPGRYAIEVTDQEALAVFKSCTVLTKSDTLHLGKVTVKPFASIRGRINPDSISGAVVAKIYGLERAVPVDTATGEYSFPDLPEGEHTVRLSPASPDLGAAIVDVPPIEAGSSDTIPTVVLTHFRNEVYAQWPHSVGIFLNTSGTGADIDRDVHQFPLLIRLNSKNFTFDETCADGRDIRFSKPDGTPMRYEIEQWDADIRSAAVWVLVDTIRGDDTTQSFIMYWGNPDAQDFSSNTAVFDTANGFAGVWHFGNANYLRDATINRNHLTDSGTAGVFHAIGSGRYLNGSAFLYALDNASLEPRSLTLSCWFTREENNKPWAKIVSKGPTHYFSGDKTKKSYNTYSLELRQKPDTLGFIVASVDTAQMCVSSPSGIAQNEFHYGAGTFDAAAGKSTVYHNGIAVDSVSNIPGILYPQESPYHLFIGSQTGDWYKPDFAGAFFRGTVDEVRLERVARSPAWIALCHENQKRQSNFITMKEW